ncbi:MAG: hypothetical protein DRJ97_04850 [Thermoprotei archaeon]|nr:MAG: hypothetical protein DRJ97_04850 [Thermoprotei archaeon]
MASDSHPHRRLALTLAVCASIIVLGALSYLYFTYLSKPVKADLVAVINIEGPILSSQDAKRYLEAISHAMSNDSIKAVVVKIDFLGGAAHLVEQVYLDLMELRDVKPVIALTDMALSGGYYIAVASDYIYAEPASFIGGVGVIGIVPPVLIPSERCLESGAYKATGFSELRFPFSLMRALDNFLQAIKRNRAERLKINLTELKRGEIYLGCEAVELGLVDEIGSLQRAVMKAAEEAHLTRYAVISLNTAPQASPEAQGDREAVDWRSLSAGLLNQYQPPPSLWYIYLPPRAAFDEHPILYSTAVELGSLKGGGGPIIVVDVSHENRISLWELDLLIAELVKRNATVIFASSWEELKGKLNEASGLIIASPTKAYTAEECRAVEDFVSRGGALLLFFDPAYEYVNVQELTRPINTIASRFGLYYAKGYLYNDKEYYGFYRNIYITSFANTTITSNLTSLVFFTATYIHSVNKGAAWTSNDTYSSLANKMGSYAVIAVVEDGEGIVVALGDQTFLKEPYCYVEDNYKLLLNIASLMLKAKNP